MDLSTADILIIAGGPSIEAADSRRSARHVADSLLELGIGVRVEEYTAELVASLLSKRPDVAFPLTHGSPGEDGSLPCLLELLGIPYVGSDMRACATAMHKPTLRGLLIDEGIRVARGRRLLVDDLAAGEQAEQLVATLGEDLVLKPSSGGSSLDVFVCTGLPSISEALHALARTHHDVLVEERIRGGEYTVGLLDSADDVVVLPILEVEPLAEGPASGMPGRSVGDRKRRCAADHLSREAYAALAGTARRVHQVLGARDWARVDLFLADDGGVVTLEVNTMPGMTPSSPYPEAAAHGGRSVGSVCAAMLQAALARGH